MSETPRVGSRFLRISGRLLLILISTALAVKIGDLALGWIDPYGISHFRHKHEFDTHSLRSNPVTPQFPMAELTPGVTVEAGCTYTTNSLGFRDRETTREKPENTFRIIVLGDSVTYGWGVEAEERFTDIVEERLNPPGRIGPRVEILNLGVPGYETTHQFVVFRRKVPELQPDVVAFVFNFNDVQFVDNEKSLLRNGYNDRLEERGRLATWMADRLMDREFSAQLDRWIPNLKGLLAYKTIFALQAGDDVVLRDLYARMEDGIRIAGDLYEGAMKEAAVIGARVAVLDLYDFEPIAEQCRERGVPYANICFDGFTSDMSLRNSASDPHPNPEGHARLADTFERALHDLKLLPGDQN